MIRTLPVVVAAALLWISAPQAAEKTAALHTDGERYGSVELPMSGAETWRVTVLDGDTPSNVPLDSIARLSAGRIDNTCRMHFGKLTLKNGETFAIEGDLRGLLKIPGRFIEARVTDPVDGGEVVHRIPCDEWKLIAFEPSG